MSTGQILQIKLKQNLKMIAEIFGISQLQIFNRMESLVKMMI